MLGLPGPDVEPWSRQKAFETGAKHWSQAQEKPSPSLNAGISPATPLLNPSAKAPITSSCERCADRRPGQVTITMMARWPLPKAGQLEMPKGAPEHMLCQAHKPTGPGGTCAQSTPVERKSPSLVAAPACGTFHVSAHNPGVLATLRAGRAS